MYSVGNGCYYVRERGTLVKVESHPAPAAVSVPPSPVMRSNYPAESGSSAHGFRIGGEETAQTLSARVAQKLLEGFTLLSESCPTTNVPLVMNAAGQVKPTH